eukprot:9488479-Pyramimonas_sp.AAC.1
MAILRSDCVVITGCLFGAHVCKRIAMSSEEVVKAKPLIYAIRLSENRGRLWVGRGGERRRRRRMSAHGSG